MNKKITMFLLLITGCMVVHAQEVILKKGMIIKKSVKVKKATYRLDAFEKLKQSVLVIEGNNIVVDFNHAQLQGSNSRQQPDSFNGVAIIIRNSRNVTIKNLTAKGYKVAVLATGVDGLKLEHCDFSYNYRQQLNSTDRKEDMSDWMSYHHNEEDQWLRYGAAIYLRSCNGAVVANCKVTGGQNALMMMECNNATIYNNDFSFNSGIGLGLYKCNSNNVMHNRINFNVRGYSHGVYSRGQDSAGILVYEQSSNNTFFNNSVTHGGDGFFLWAGQTTIDTGRGGCNGNRVIGNDFSFAPTNGIEVTFSSNLIQGNRIFECDHGIWGGYSYETLIRGNQFRNNRIGVAIEHGQKNRIENNIFYQDQEAIRLWSRKEQPPDWGYAKYHDTRSVNYQIILNSFNRNPLVYNLSGTDSLKIFTNTYSNCNQLYKTDSTVTHLDTVEREIYDSSYEIMSPMKNLIDPFKGNGKLAGRKNIMITEWGPYDFRYPLIWRANPVDTSGVLSFNVLGPRGKWRILSSNGIGNIERASDTFPSSLTARKIISDRTDIELVAEYIPAALFTDQFGKTHPKGKPFRFVFRDFFQPIQFNISWYAYDSLSNPLKTEYLERVKYQRPFRMENATQLDYAWWGGIRSGEAVYKQYLTIADGYADIPVGNYELAVTWDDAVRVYLDGKLLIDEWNPMIHQFDESPHRKINVHLGGQHQFRVEHVELGGFATLKLKLEKKH